MSYLYKLGCLTFGLAFTALVGACDHEDLTPRHADDNIPCGGFAGAECPAGLVCADDPGDDCDPEHGADCGGICIDPGPAPCGGFAGLTCPVDQVCVDDPRDTCDPELGGADCAGICENVDGEDEHGRPDRPRKPRPAKPGKPAKCNDDKDREYVSHDPNQCAAILFHCADGQTAFFDECGCGCTTL